MTNTKSMTAFFLVLVSAITLDKKTLHHRTFESKSGMRKIPQRVRYG